MLDPEVVPLLTPDAPPVWDVPLDQARREMIVGSQGLADRAPVDDHQDLEAPGPAGPIPVRLYRPARRDGAAVVYYHGGGWVLGGIATHDAYCRWLADASGAAVASVDYRLAPEHPFPAAWEDSCAALRWLLAESSSLKVDPQRVAVAGDSAGGNLAACVALEARRAQLPVACQLLIYPIVGCDFELPSYREFATGFNLTRPTMEWFWDQYAPRPADRSDWRLNPLACESLAGLPPALVQTAECDPLRDEGELYARRLQECGVDAQLRRYPGMIHGFVRRLRLVAKAREALQDAGAFLRQQLG